MTDTTTSKQTKPPLPACERYRPTAKGGRKRCTNPGFWCWVTGEFGRTAKLLCGPCKAELITQGWTVRYQIEGDSPQTQQQG